MKGEINGNEPKIVAYILPNTIVREKNITKLEKKINCTIPLKLSM